MRGNWNLSAGEAAYWQEVITNKLNYLIENKDSIDDIDLSQEDISPYQLYNVLEYLGYERDDLETNGWEQDTWARYSNNEERISLCIFSCGMTFELKIMLNRVGDWMA